MKQCVARQVEAFCTSHAYFAAFNGRMASNMAIDWLFVSFIYHSILILLFCFAFAAPMLDLFYSFIFLYMCSKSLKGYSLEKSVNFVCRSSQLNYVCHVPEIGNNSLNHQRNNLKRLERAFSCTRARNLHTP